MKAAVVGLLAARGAGEIDHPGGTLLEHLLRVYGLLGEWGARPAVRLAGLSHAFYGTDGFPVSLGDVARRKDLAVVIGDAAERLVYLYGSCDRAFTYPRMARDGAAFRDRFTGEVRNPVRRLRQDFAELTVANELDVMKADAGIRDRFGRELIELFGSWSGLLSGPAREAVAVAGRR